LPGIISATLHRSKDGTRVVNYAQWKTSENWEKLLEVGKSSYFAEMGKFAKPDAHLYEVCYQLDKTKDR
jgi:Antibiotic biosynthesis monooxygenase